LLFGLHLGVDLSGRAMHAEISDAVLSGLQFGTQVMEPLLPAITLGRLRGPLHQLHSGGAVNRETQ
jgi:hypothetical protein